MLSHYANENVKYGIESVVANHDTCFLLDKKRGKCIFIRIKHLIKWYKNTHYVLLLCKIGMMYVFCLNTQRRKAYKNAFFIDTR